MSASDPGRCGEFDGLAAARRHGGDMAAAERAAFDAHLAGCARCRDAMERQRLLDDLLVQLPEYRVPAPGRPVARPRRATALVAAAAVLCLLVLPARKGGAGWTVGEAVAADAALAVRAPGAAGPGGPRHANPGIPWLGFVGCAAWIEPRVEGIYLCALAPRGPLGSAGAQAGDVLVAVEGRPVRRGEEMYAAFAGRSVGDRVRVAFRGRSGVRRATVVLAPRRLGPRHPFDLQWSPALRASLERTPPGGVDVDEVFVPLPDSTAARLGTGVGVLVARSASPEQSRRTLLAALPYLFGPEGLRPGDVVTAVGERPVTAPATLWPALMEVQKVPFTLTVRRGARTVRLRFNPAP